MTETHTKIGLLILAIGLVLGGYYFYNGKKSESENVITLATQPVEVAAQGWKTYNNSQIGFIVSYPSDFRIIEKSGNGLFSFGIVDSNEKSYLNIEVWTDAQAVESVRSMFTGSYPKIIESREASPNTIVQRALNETEGIESFGKGGGGEGFQDSFQYIDRYYWVLRLNPILEGKVTTAEEADLSSKGVAEDLSRTDREIYQQILKSFKITSSK